MWDSGGERRNNPYYLRPPVSSPSLRWSLLRLFPSMHDRTVIHRALTGTDEPVPKLVRYEMRVLLDQSGGTRQW